MTTFSIELLQQTVSTIEMQWKFSDFCDAFKLYQKVKKGQWTTKYFGQRKKIKVTNLEQNTCFTFQLYAMTIIDDTYQVSATSEIIQIATLANTPSSAAIQRAVKKSQNHILEMILSQKPDLSELIFANNLSVLGQAVMSNNEEAVAILLEHGANVEIGCVATQKTPLHMAVFNGQLKIAKLLVDNKANVHATDKIGHHIGHFAVDSNNVEALKFCLRYKVELEHNDCMNWTLLLRAVVTKTNLAVVKLLLDINCNVTAKDKNLMTTLDHAVLGYQLDVMKLLENKAKQQEVTEHVKN